jgi:mandelate racemase
MVEDWADPVVAQPFALKDGNLIVPDLPGSGLEWNEEAVARFRYDA